MDTPSNNQAYDAFGDVDVGRSRETGSRRADKVVAAVFWSIALLLIAGRVYQSDITVPKTHSIEIASR